MKKSGLSKALILIMLVALLVSACQGGGATTKGTTGGGAGDDALEPVKLIWYSVIDAIRPDHDMVWEKLAEYFKEKINVELESHFYTSSDYIEKMPTLVSAGDPMDMMFTSANWLPYVENTQRGAFMAIDDLVQQYAPVTYRNLPEGAWEAMKIDGKIYGVPPYKDLADRWSWLYNETMAEAYDLKIPQSGEWSTWFDVVDIVYEAKAARDKDKPELADTPIMGMQNTVNRFYPYEQIHGMACVNVPGIESIKGQGSGEKVFNLYDTPEYADVCKQVKKYVDDGIMPYDSANWDKDKAIVNSGVLLGSFAGGYIQVNPDFYGGCVTKLSTPDLVVMTTAYVRSGMQAVAAQCKNPERALMLIELLNTDEYVATTVRFGLEDLHYKVNEDDLVDPTLGSRNEGVQATSEYAYYTWYGWQFGNIVAGKLPVAAKSNEFKTLMKELNDNSIQDTNLGFSLDTTPIANEIAACTNVIKEYDDNLRGGMIEDIDGQLDEFNAKLKANGSEKIIEEVQKQLTDWRKAAGKPTD